MLSDQRPGRLLLQCIDGAHTGARTHICSPNPPTHNPHTHTWQQPPTHLHVHLCAALGLDRLPHLAVIPHPVLGIPDRRRVADLES